MSLVSFFHQNYLSNSTSALQCPIISILFNYICMSFKEDVVKRVLVNPGWCRNENQVTPGILPFPHPPQSHTPVPCSPDYLQVP